MVICMISSHHGLYDDRIYWKEALSLSAHGYQVIHLATGSGTADFVSEHGIRLIQVDRKRYFDNPYIDFLWRKLSFRPDVYKRLLEVCRDLKADVYHIHDLQLNRIGWQLRQMPGKPRVIYDVHEDYKNQIPDYIKIRGLSWLVRLYAACIGSWERRKLCLYDAVITAIPAVAGQFKNLVGPGRLHVVRNYTHFNPSTFLAYEEKEYDAIYAGLINRYRGGIEMAEAVALVKKMIPTVRVLVVGPLPDRKYAKKLKKRIADLQLENNLLLRPPVPSQEVGRLLARSRTGLAIFMPVPMFHYGIQVKTFEYMIYGLPIVCSNFGNVNQVISENQAGVAVNPQRPGDIAGALIKLLTEREFYEQLSRNAIKAARSRYRWKQEEKKLLAVYRNLSV